MWQNITVEFTRGFRRRGVKTNEKRVRKVPKIAWTWNKRNSKIGRKGNGSSEAKS